MTQLVESIKIFFGFEPTPLGSEADDMVSSVPAEPVRAAAKKPRRGTVAFPASEIKVDEPRIYEDSLTIANTLRQHKPVIVKLTYLDQDTGKRLIDFVCGTAYAINGHMLKIGPNIFLFTPTNVSINHADEIDTRIIPAANTDYDSVAVQDSHANSTD